MGQAETPARPRGHRTSPACIQGGQHPVGVTSRRHSIHDCLPGGRVGAPRAPRPRAARRALGTPASGAAQTQEPRLRGAPVPARGRGRFPAEPANREARCFGGAEGGAGRGAPVRAGAACSFQRRRGAPRPRFLRGCPAPQAALRDPDPLPAPAPPRLSPPAPRLRPQRSAAALRGPGRAGAVRGASRAGGGDAAAVAASAAGRAAGGGRGRDGGRSRSRSAPVAGREAASTRDPSPRRPRGAGARSGMSRRLRARELAAPRPPGPPQAPARRAPRPPRPR